MKITQGDLIKKAKDGEFDLIVHGCNCFCEMGAGIAKKIKREFPEAFVADQKTSKGDRKKLGICSFAEIENKKLIVVNAYTQFDFRGRGVKVDYDAVRSCMNWIKMNFPGRKMGIPKIGAGLAGGNWDTIAKIIEDELGDEDVTRVEYKP